MSLDCGRLYVEVWVTPVLAQVTFVHADALSLILQEQYLTLGEESILGPPLIFWTFFKEAVFVN